MKRSHSPESPPVQEQHSTSLAPVLPPLARQDNPIRYLLKSVPFGDYHEYCDRYNRVVQFAPDPSSDNEINDQYRHAAKAQTTVQEIRKLVLDFTSEPEAKVAQLQGEVNAFERSLRSSHRFYERGDVLSLAKGEFYTLLAPQVTDDWDIDDFIAYVSRILPQAAKKEKPTDEHDSAYDRDTFFNKCLIVIQIIADRGRRKETLYLLVLLKSVIREVHARELDTETSLQHDRIDRIIKAFVDDTIRARITAVLGVNALPDPRRGPLEDGEVEVHSFRWTPIATDADGPFYWDFASTIRPLHTAYMDRICSYDSLLDKVDAPERDNSSACCFHQKSVQLLNWLQTRAWSELCTNVFLTIGTILPPELTEYVFECALEAQGVPLNPKTSETHTVEPESKLSLRHRYYRSTKPAYKCCLFGIQDPDHCYFG